MACHHERRGWRQLCTIFHYQQDELYCEGIPLRKLAEAVGTPCYVYSYATLRQHFTVFDNAFTDVPHMICFSVKSNSNIAILNLFGSLGGGVDIVSGGELFRARKAGIPADRDRLFRSWKDPGARSIMLLTRAS